MTESSKVGEQEFIEWLSHKNPSLKQSLSSSFRSIISILQTRLKLSKSLFEITSPKQIEELRPRATSLSFKRNKIRRNIRSFLDAYLEYLREKSSPAEASPQEKEIQIGENWIPFEYGNGEVFIGTKPAICIFDGEVLEFKDWSSLLVNFVECIISKNQGSSKLKELSGDSIFSSKQGRPLFMRDKLEGNLACSRLSNGYYLNTNTNTRQKIELMCKLCKFFDYGEDKFKLYCIPADVKPTVVKPTLTEEKPEADQQANVDIDDTSTGGVIRFDFNKENYDDFLETYPVHCTIAGWKIPGKTWIDMLVNLTDYELEQGKHDLSKLRQEHLLSNRNGVPFINDHKIGNFVGVYLKDGSWIYAKAYSIPTLMKQVIALCHFCGYSDDQITLSGVKKSASSVLSPDLPFTETVEDNAQVSTSLQSENASPECSGDKLIVFTGGNAEDFENLVPESCSLDSEPLNGKDWLEVFIAVIEREIRGKNPKLNSLKRKNLVSSVSGYFFTERKPRGLECHKLSNGLWIKTKYSNAELVRLIMDFCMYCGYAWAQVRLCGTREEANPSSSIYNVTATSLPNNYNSDVTISVPASDSEPMYRVNSQPSAELVPPTQEHAHSLPSPPRQDNQVCFNFNNANEFTNAKFESCSLNGKIINATSWKNLLLKIVQHEFENHGDAMEGLLGHPFPGKNGMEFLLRRKPRSNFQYYDPVPGCKCWLKTHGNTSKLLDTIGALLKYCNDAKEVKIIGRKFTDSRSTNES